MKKPSILWKVITIFIAIFVGSVLIDSWVLEPDRINHVCNKIYVGTPINEVFTRAKEFNVRAIESRPLGEDLKFITLYGGSFSRYICEVKHDGKQVISSEFKKSIDR